ncbi:tRNA1(Val) (adenine(37)-N6)-methyltransferase [Ekhidna sp.]
MSNDYFQFKQFLIQQANSGMKVTTDGCLFGAWVASEINANAEPKKILDIGAGTGLLSLMLAQATQQSQIEAVEINTSAFEEALSNFSDSKWSERLKIYQSPIQDFSVDSTYDLILSNPPFFTDSQKGTIDDKNQALHSSDLPMQALLKAVLALLSKDGTFYVLFPEREMDRFIELANKSQLCLTESLEVRNQSGSKVFRKMAAFSFREKEFNQREIIIRKSDGRYTDEFWSLLEEFYLEYNDPYFKTF